MSVSIRPVVETWGEFLTYSLRGEAFPSIDDILKHLANLADPKGSNGVIEYGDVQSVYIENGAVFLDWLDRTNLRDIMDNLAAEYDLNPDDDGYKSLREDVAGMQSLIPAWRKSIGSDGELRFYCD